MSRIRRSTFLVAAFVLVGLAAACGSGGSSTATISIGTLRAAASNSQGASSQSFDMTMEFSVQGRDLTIKGSGTVTADGKYGSMSFDFAGLGMVEARVTPDGYYYDYSDIPAIAEKLPSGKRWMFLSYDTLRAQSGTDPRDLSDQTTQNSSQALEYLEATTGDVTRIGDETVSGAHAVHYRTHIDYAKFAAEKLADAKPEVRSRIAKLGTVPADVWIGDSDRVVKMRYAVDSQVFGAPSGSVEVTMEITGYGVPVSVETPPADQVFDAGALSASSSA